MDDVTKMPGGARKNPGDEDHLDAEALYTRGMAHYRRREWQRAMEYFVRLKALEPNRPGIDALLDELDWFIQLQAMGPETQAIDIGAEDVEHAREPEVREVPQPRPKTKQSRGRLDWRWLAWPLAVVVVVAGAFLLLTYQRPDPIQDLYNRAQARMSVGDYEGAIQAYEEILARDPNHQGAQFGLEKARKLANLTLLYQNAQVYISNGQWEQASAELNKILEIDPSYDDVSTLAQTVERRKTVSALYDEGLEYFQAEEWAKAIDRFERVRVLDTSFQDSDVRDKLYAAYLNLGIDTLADPKSGITEVRSAIQQFSSALSLRPQSQEAADLKRDAEAYLAGYTSYANEEWDLAITRFLNLYSVKPDYASGNLAQLLYQSYISRGDVYRDGGQYIEAVADYQTAQTIGVPDVSVAAAREAEIFTTYITPTPTPTSTPTATPTPRPTNTRVPPTATPVPPTPVPPTQPPPPATNTPVPPPPTRPPR